jgi:hypothetical protein
MAATLPPRRPAAPSAPGPDPATAAHASVRLDDAEEARPASSEAGREVGAALLALSRTARSFTLYDAQNEAVRGFLADLQAKFQKALAQLGELSLEVRPFELVFRGETVYLERERERSLAFRLFRDGVRRLTFDAALAWNDLLGLVEILSLRYAGVRQQEDDVVTLLHKAAFTHIRFAAVEGFVPDEEIADEGGPREVERLPAPRDLDQPPPELPPAIEPAWRELPQDALARLRAEESPATVAADALSLALDLLALADQRETELEDLGAYLVETRDFLVAEGDFARLEALCEALERHAQQSPVLHALLPGFAGPDALQRLLQWARRHPPPPSEDLLACLARQPGDAFAAVLDALPGEADTQARAMLGALAEGLVAGRDEDLLRRLAQADTRSARELLGIVARALPSRLTEAALLLKDVPDPQLQLDLLHALRGAPYDPALGRAALRLLSAQTVDVALSAAEYLSAAREPRAFEACVRRLGEAGAHGEPRLLAGLGRAMAELRPDASEELFALWLEPRGLLGRSLEGSTRRAQQWAALSGMARLPGETPERVLRAFLEHSSGDLHQHCLAALVERRRAAHLLAPAGAVRGG